MFGGMGRATRRRSRWWAAVAVAAVGSLGLSHGARAASIAVRGVEAEAMFGGFTRVADPTASDGAAIELSPGHRAHLRVTTVRTRRIVVTVAAGCSSRWEVLLRIGSGPPVALPVGSTSWHSVGANVDLPAGSHEVVLTVVSPRRHFMRCAVPKIDRFDFLPAKLQGYVLLGAAMRAANLASDGRYRALFAARVDSLTPENELKMHQLEPQQGKWDFGPADELVHFAASHGDAVRGHTLVYGTQSPGWFNRPTVPWTPVTLLREMRSYITTVMHRYDRWINTWDVVNEAFNPDGSYQHNTFYDVLGPSYVEDAFRFAHQADPSAELFYNDGIWDPNSAHAQAVLAMVNDFKRRGVPIDGIGIENHTDYPGYPRQDMLQALMTKFAQLGLRVEITEMDVGIGRAPGTLQQRYQEQAQAYRAAATACWDIAACHRFTTWGLYDGLTWVGSNQMPLLFNTNYQPKPGYFAVAQALHLNQRAALNAHLHRRAR